MTLDGTRWHSEWVDELQRTVLRRNFKGSCSREEVMMGKFIDLTGQRFGRLEVIGKVEKPSNRKYTSAYWLCKCDCGNKKVVASNDLRRGVTKSCGCLLSQMAIIKCGN